MSHNHFSGISRAYDIAAIGDFPQRKMWFENINLWLDLGFNAVVMIMKVTAFIFHIKT